MKAHSVLGHLSILVAGGQVAQGTDGWLCDVFSVAGPQHGSHQSLDTSNLACHWINQWHACYYTKIKQLTENTQYTPHRDA